MTTEVFDIFRNFQNIHIFKHVEIEHWVLLISGHISYGIGLGYNAEPTQKNSWGARFNFCQKSRFPLTTACRNWSENTQKMKLKKMVTSYDFFLIPPRKHSWVVDKCKKPHGKIYSFTHFLDFWRHFWIFWTSCYPAPLFILQNYQISTESNALGLKISVIAPETNLVRFRVIIFSPFSRKTFENGSFWHFSNFS